MERRRAFKGSTILWSIAIIANLIFVNKVGANPALIQQCKQNAAKGDKANPQITALCAAMNIQVEPEEECIPLPPLSPPSAITDLISDLQDGVKEMDKQRGSSHGEKAVFVLGNTGSGKSTVTHMVARNLSRLHATSSDGSMVIIDEDQKIGAPTTKSKTLLPEFAHDSENDVFFWDCPGFDDNRGDDVDTAAMFFLKYVLDTTSQVKLLFTIPENSVRSGGSRSDFDLLASHASRLMKNISKFEDSIGLAVTKTPGFSPNDGRQLSEDEIMRSITGFLELYVTDMKRDLTGLTEESKRKGVERKIMFAEAIHKQGETGNKGKLFFIRSPKKCGVLGKMDSVVYTREKLQSLVGNLTFTPVAPNDFMYTLKDSTLNKLKIVTIPATKERIVENMRYFTENVRLQFSNRFYEESGSTTEDRLVYLKKMDSVVKEISDTIEIEHLPAQGQFATFIEKLFKRFNFTIDESKLSPQKRLEHQLSFFRNVTNKDDVWDGKYQEGFLKPLTSIENGVKNLTTFYQFCKDTELELVKYSQQSTLSKLVNKVGSGERLYFSDDVLQFLATEKLSSVPFSVTSLWENRVLRGVDKLHLIDLVDDTIPIFEFWCSVPSGSSDKNRVIVSGRRYLRLSDAMNESKWPPNCKGGISELSIVAMDILFLDTDIQMPGVHVSMVAPTWQVITEGESVRKINLQTSTGKNEETGTYFGFHDQIQNGNKLIINANPMPDEWRAKHDYKSSFMLNNPDKNFLAKLNV